MTNSVFRCFLLHYVGKDTTNMSEKSTNQSASSQKVLYLLSGKVIRGRGIGKLVGTPTADIRVSFPENLPPIGVYISSVILDSKKYASVTNIGNRPTIDNDDDISVETLILDFHSDIYDEYIDIELLKFIRLPQKFSSLTELRSQVLCDCQTARLFFGISTNNTNDANHCSSTSLQLGALQIDTPKRSVTIQNRMIPLTTKEYDLLYLLASHPGWAYSKEQIYESIWREPAVSSYHPVENLVCQLRKKLKSNCTDEVPTIKTIIGYGYKLII